MSRSRRLGSRLALVAALVADLLTYGPPAGVSGPDDTTLAAALAAQAQVTDEWLAIEGVVGTAVGLAGSGQATLTVYVTAAGIARLPQTVAGVPVRVEVTGPFVALTGSPGGSGEGSSIGGAGAGVGSPRAEGGSSEVDPKRGFPRPVPIGVSAGHPDVSAGTIGARVTDGSRVFALSNNHVFAASNGGRLGDNLLQPGVADGGRNPEDRVGTLHDFEPIRFCGDLACPSNRIDAALALTTADDLGTETPDGGYGGPRSTPQEGTLGLRVQKYGRTTGLTEGRITGVNATLDVNYRGGTARFTGQIVISGEGFSAGGDSGSLVVSKGILFADRRPVGLLFAGSPTSTVANPIDLVLERFGVTVDEG